MRRIPIKQNIGGAMNIDIDLFGNNVEQKVLTSMHRIATRQVSLQGRDLYTTEPKDIDRFIKATKKDGLEILSPIWEPAAGRGDISKTLIQNGHTVYSTDIIAYQDKDIVIEPSDFFLCRKAVCSGETCRTIFTNPPFNTQEEFLIHALSMGIDVIFFVRLSFLSSIRRYKIYEKYNPDYVYVYTARAHCYKNGDVSKGQNMIDYCMIVWKPPYKAETIMRWIP
jgi:hypothetical protein